jgi:hypothetical protein
MINDLCGSPNGVFKGIYEIDSDDDNVKVYSFFSGMGLPKDRIEQLRIETKELQAKVKNKEVNRNLTLKVGNQATEIVSEAQKIKNKIASKSSAFGKLLGNSIKK